jgi:Na+/H+ antiporter NhaD/arsenite permease-like protein
LAFVFQKRVADIETISKEKQATIRDAGKHISWSIFGFIAGMFIVVRAVEETNLTAQFGQLLLHLSGGSSRHEPDQ